MPDITQEQMQKALQYDPGLDVEALVASLQPRIRSGQIRNPAAVFVTAAKEAKAQGKFRRGAADPASTHRGFAPPPATDQRDLARALRDLLHEAAHGKLPGSLANGARMLAITTPSQQPLLMALADILATEGDGWDVDRDGDIPF